MATLVLILENCFKLVVLDKIHFQSCSDHFFQAEEGWALIRCLLELVRTCCNLLELVLILEPIFSRWRRMGTNSMFVVHQFSLEFSLAIRTHNCCSTFYHSDPKLKIKFGNCLEKPRTFWSFNEILKSYSCQIAVN